MTPEEYAFYALRRIAASRHRMSRGRRLVVEALARLTEPASAYTLRDLLHERGEDVHVTSVYRTLDVLEACGLVHQIPASDGYLPCRLIEQPGVHLHLICQACGAVEEVTSLEMDRVEARVSSTSRFAI